MDEDQLGDAAFQLTGAIEGMAERFAWAPRDMVTIVVMAGFELAHRNFVGTGGIEFIRDVADTVERDIMRRAH